MSPRGDARGLCCFNQSARFPKIRNRVRGLRHTPCLNGRGRLKKHFSDGLFYVWHARRFISRHSWPGRGRI
ncbi:chorismate mutase/prephenate dehydrogenase [Neisseria bacilliformis ATCC BAA-1200]|uniref:Chorismate mutase/prephenate dehydrogenase n=1 Tax=Neisseria bacilliformis ATCC BAA-1200 TaxID=888742 RepID=F2BG60_9NEIS|nr:chorismate mutase/prephenate dehydrogenase [Neisseria bacilliformis ATCC BAA-1200]